MVPKCWGRFGYASPAEIQRAGPLRGSIPFFVGGFPGALQGVRAVPSVAYCAPSTFGTLQNCQRVAANLLSLVERDWGALHEGAKLR